MQKYKYLRFAATVFVVVGWIVLVLAAVVFIAGLGGEGLTRWLGELVQAWRIPPRVLVALVATLYTILLFVYGVMFLASGQAFHWMRDMEEHAGAIRTASQPPAKEG